ncbi:hypothetical protein FHY15_000495 [Xanthomonas arboricola]|nr:hypothetical protein [Xanthomonas arboricola]
MDIFLSVGNTANKAQEDFVCAVESRLRSEGLNPRTVGRNHFSLEAPLKTVTELVDQCAGTVVIALERLYFPEGIERRNGPKQSSLTNISLPTPWNQIEAALSYSRGLPLLVIVANEVRSEGLLEPGYDWYVQRVQPTEASLHTPEFNGVLASWKCKLAPRLKTAKATPDPSQMTVGQLIAGLRPAQLWTILGALAALIGGTFALGARLAGGA